MFWRKSLQALSWTHMCRTHITPMWCFEESFEYLLTNFDRKINFNINIIEILSVNSTASVFDPNQIVGKQSSNIYLPPSHSQISFPNRECQSTIWNKRRFKQIHNLGTSFYMTRTHEESFILIKVQKILFLKQTRMYKLILVFLE